MGSGKSRGSAPPWRTTSRRCTASRTTSTASSQPSSRCWPNWKVGAGPAAASSLVAAQGLGLSPGVCKGRRAKARGNSDLGGEGGGSAGERRAFHAPLCVEAGCLEAVAVNLLSLQGQRPCHLPGAPGPRWAGSRSPRPTVGLLSRRPLLEGTLLLVALQVDLHNTERAVPRRGSWPPTSRGTGPCFKVFCRDPGYKGRV